MADPDCNTTLPKSKTSTYRIWLYMKKRCENPRAKIFQFYGARGITVCQRWHAFEYFLVDMGERPGPDYSLDRIDNNGGYEPKNCRWATRAEQNNNTRRNLLYTINGTTRTLAEWCKEYGISYITAYNRVLRGWDVVKALTAAKQHDGHVDGRSRDSSLLLHCETVPELQKQSVGRYRYVCSICSFAPEGHQPYKSKAERQWNRRVIRHGNELNDIAAQALAEADRVEE